MEGSRSYSNIAMILSIGTDKVKRERRKQTDGKRDKEKEREKDRNRNRNRQTHGIFV